MQDDINEIEDSPEEEVNTYWAAGDTRDCADEVLQKCDQYWKYCQTNGWFEMWRRLYYAYNPNKYTMGQTVKAGENNEFRTIKVNHFKNLLEHIQTLTITDRPAWQPQSTNSDAASQKQTIIATGLLDYMMRAKRVERHLRDATRNALLFTEGYVAEKWDPTAGSKLAVDVETGESRSDGDIFYTSFEPVDVVRDLGLKSFSQRSWIVCRTYENKFDVASRYKEYYDEITNTKISSTKNDHYLSGINYQANADTDMIAVLTFYHVKSAACPEGRQMVMLPDGTVLSDSILLYAHIPVHRIVSADQIGTPFGMSISTDLLPLQEMLDAHYTTILSINENFSIPKILIPIGSQIGADNMSAGFQTISYNAESGPPSILAMPTAPDGLFKAMAKIQQDMETISGVNSVSRGQPEASLKSGSALALVQSMAIQFHAPLQQSYIGLLEDVGTATIEIMKDYADTPRVIQIAGKRNKGIIQESFTGNDISSINRVQVQAGNPLSKTVSGRLSIAQDLLQNKIITNAAEYLQVLQTGELDPLIQGSTAVLLNLATENEMLLDGMKVPVMFTDDHMLHITEHTALASDPTIRMDPSRFALLAEHIQEHIAMLTDPAYANFRQLMGQPVLQGQPQPGNGPDMGQNPAAQPTLGSVSPGAVGSSQVQEMAADVKMPNAPANAMTGERAPLQTSQL